MSERLPSDQESQCRKQQYRKYLEETIAKLKTNREHVYAQLSGMFDRFDGVEVWIMEDAEEYMSELIDLVPVDYDTWLKVTLEAESFAAYCSGIRPEPVFPHEDDDFYSEMDDDQADVMRHIDCYTEEPEDQENELKPQILQVIETDELPF